jgi:hypothetical protein
VTLTVDEIVVGDAPDAWARAGFRVDGDTTRLGTVQLRFVGRDAGRGIRRWSLRGLPADWSGDLDGLATDVSTGPEHEPVEHPLGVASIDHVVVATPDVERSLAAFADAGLAPRGERTTDTYGAPMRQNFFRLGEVIVELIGFAEPTGDGPCGFFGLALTVTDLDAAADLLGTGLGAAKDAVQPGRRIATVRHRDLGISVALALMTPEPDRAGGGGR